MTMRPPSIRAVLAGLFAISLTTAVPLAGAEAAAAKDQVAQHLGPSTFTKSPTNKISRAQLVSLEKNANQHVIVVLKNQFHGMIAPKHAITASRESAIAQAQAPVLSELREVKAKHVLGFSIINAVRATVSKSEIAHLRSDSAVRAVVPDATVHLAPYYTSDVAPKAKSSTRSNAALPACNTKAQKPELDPEALQVTNTAFLDHKTPQAQNMTDGSGVVVGIVSGGLDYFNPDLIRPDGQPVIIGEADFTGNGLGTEASSDIESFIDVGSVAAQANETYNLNNFVNAAFRSNKNACRNIKILGMAPGASVLWAQSFAADTGSNSSIVQGIQFLAKNGANVISESFGAEPIPDTGIDITSMANDAAVAAGISVVASSGDAGTNGTLSSSADDPNVIAAGASTTFRSYKQVVEQGFELGKGGYLDNNISSFSSSGVNESGTKSVDVVAPGDLNWIICSENYPGCVDNDGGPSPIYQSGGTSESAPLTAGEAALIDSEYAKTHGGAMPSPVVVKQIITSTATNLNEPAVEQGAGLINSYKAVQAARNYGKSAGGVEGNALLTSVPDLSAQDAAGAAENLHFSVTNDGENAQSVTPYPLMQGAPFNVQNYTVNLDPATEPTFINSGGAPRGYEKQTFTVGKKVQHLSVSIAWNVTTQPGTIAYLIVFDPKGRYAAYSEPQGLGSGYANVDVRMPMAGTWTAVIASRVVGSSAYNGAVQLSVASSNLVGTGTVTPKTAKIKPGMAKIFTFHTSIPTTSGDASQEIEIIGRGPSKSTSVSAGVVPVFLRSLVPLGANGGTFAGSFLGANGRGGQPDYQTWAFNVPSGLTDLDASISLSDPNYNIDGFLINPEGLAEDYQSTVTANDPKTGAPTAETGAMQFYYRDPEPGVWHLVLALQQSSGQQISEPFAGTIAFNQGAASVSATGVPNVSGATLPAGTPVTATLNVTNNSSVTENYFVDPRLSEQTNLYLGEAGLQLPTSSSVNFDVPTDTSQITVEAEGGDPAIPISMEVGPFSGDPDVGGIPAFVLPGVNTSTAVVSNPSGSRELTPGLWFAQPEMDGPFASAQSDTALVGALVTTQEFAADVSSSTGDFWQYATGQSPTAPTYLTLAPGASGQITVTFTPGTDTSEKSGTAVTGDLELDTFSSSVQQFINGGGQDEVASIPFTYTIQ